jgi:hypothetical protein
MLTNQERNMRDRSKKTLTIKIENLTEAQVIALEDLFTTWVWLGGFGNSRWTSFYADGDGDFRPEIQVIEGEKSRNPRFTDLLPREQFWKDGHHGDYKIDFDWIGWKLSEKEK